MTDENACNLASMATSRKSDQKKDREEKWSSERVGPSGGWHPCSDSRRCSKAPNEIADAVAVQPAIGARLPGYFEASTILGHPSAGRWSQCAARSAGPRAQRAGN